MTGRSNCTPTRRGPWTAPGPALVASGPAGRHHGGPDHRGRAPASCGGSPQAEAEPRVSGASRAGAGTGTTAAPSHRNATARLAGGPGRDGRGPEGTRVRCEVRDRPRAQGVPQAGLRAGDKHHAAIERRQGRVFLVDLGSTNGTIVGGRLIRGQEVEITDGEHIQIGPTVSTLSIVPAGEAAEAVEDRAAGWVQFEGLSPPPAGESLSTEEVRSPTSTTRATDQVRGDPGGPGRHAAMPEMDDEAANEASGNGSSSCSSNRSRAGRGQPRFVGHISRQTIAILLAHHFRLDRAGGAMRDLPGPRPDRRAPRPGPPDHAGRLLPDARRGRAGGMGPHRRDVESKVARAATSRPGTPRLLQEADAPGGSSSTGGLARRRVRLVLEENPGADPGPGRAADPEVEHRAADRPAAPGTRPRKATSGRSRRRSRGSRRGGPAQRAGRAARQARRRTRVRNEASGARRAPSAAAPASSRPSGTADRPPPRSGAAASPRAPGRSPIPPASRAAAAPRPPPIPPHPAPPARRPASSRISRNSTTASAEPDRASARSDSSQPGHSSRWRSSLGRPSRSRASARSASVHLQSGPPSSAVDRPLPRSLQRPISQSQPAELRLSCATAASGSSPRVRPSSTAASCSSSTQFANRDRSNI